MIPEVTLKPSVNFEARTRRLSKDGHLMLSHHGGRDYYLERPLGQVASLEGSRGLDWPAAGHPDASWCKFSALLHQEGLLPSA